MPRFEYRLGFAHPNTATVEECVLLERWLNDMSALGWELFLTTANNYYIFRRLVDRIESKPQRKKQVNFDYGSVIKNGSR